MVTMTFTRDMIERLIATALQAGLSVFVLTDLSSAKSAIIAAGAALLSGVKAILAKQVGNKGNASLAN